MQAHALSSQNFSRHGAVIVARSGQAFAVLRDHYAEIEALLERLDETPTTSSAIRESLFSRFAEKLLLQIDLEETIFYPALEASAPREVRRGLDELEAAKRLLEELLGLQTDDLVFEAKLHLLSDVLGKHATRDEYRLFPVCETALPFRQLDALGARMHYYLTGDCGMLPIDHAAIAETHLFI